jgi:hypothetical protein
MCDDWTDLIVYVVQKYLRRLQTCGRFEMGLIHKSSNELDDQEDLSSISWEQNDEKFFGRIQGERHPRPEIESLLNQLLHSGLLFLFFTIELVLMFLIHLQVTRDRLFGFNRLY